MSDRVSIDFHAGVADVRLNRPDKMNAVDNRMFIEVAAAGRELGRDRSLRAVVLSGEGRAFCAGLDTANFASMTSGSRDTEGPEFNAFGVPGTVALAAPGEWDAQVPMPEFACFGELGAQPDGVEASQSANSTAGGESP